MKISDLSPLQYRVYVKSLLKSKGYNPHPKQQELHNSTRRYKVIRCGRRFGKSLYAVNEMIICALLKKVGTYWFVAPTYRQAKEIAWKLFDKYLPQELVVKRNETDLTFKLVGGSQISLKGADNPDSLRGVGVDGLVMDECAFIDPYAWEVTRPILADTQGWATFISTPNGYNWFHDIYMNEGKDEYKDQWQSFHYSSYDNPYLPKEEIDDMRRTMTDTRFDQECMAEFTAQKDKIFELFSREHHVKPKRAPKDNAVIFGSIDFGFAKGHPTCFQLHEVTSEEVFTFDGFMEEGLTLDQIDEYMRAMTNGLVIRQIFADSARPDLIEDLQKKGWPIGPARKDVEAGIQKVEEMMKINPLTNKPRWTISGHLDTMIIQIENYKWAMAKQSGSVDNPIYKKVPKKVEDDACDCTRYMIYNYEYSADEYDYDESSYQPLSSRTGY